MSFIGYIVSYKGQNFVSCIVSYKGQKGQRVYYPPLQKNGKIIKRKIKTFFKKLHLHVKAIQKTVFNLCSIKVGGFIWLSITLLRPVLIADAIYDTWEIPNSLLKCLFSLIGKLITSSFSSVIRKAKNAFSLDQIWRSFIFVVDVDLSLLFQYIKKVGL